MLKETIHELGVSGSAALKWLGSVEREGPRARLVLMRSSERLEDPR